MAETTLLQRLDGLDARFEEIGTLITDPNVIADQRRYVKLTKEYKSLETLLGTTHRYRKLLNGIEQAKQFTEATQVNALALTKLDGTAKGGVIIGISDQFKIPVRYIGLGEKMEDLQIFNAKAFVDSLFE